MSLKDDLADRVRKLKLNRAEIVGRHATELAVIDRQIIGGTRILAAWDTLTIDQALAAVETAGLKIRVDG